MRDTILLMRKNLKEDLRRPKGCTCEMLCPVIIFLLFALLRSTISSDTVDINYGDNQYWAKRPVFHDYTDYTSSTTQYDAYQDIARLICLNEFEDRGSTTYYPAGYLAIIPPPSTNSKIQHIINTMTSTWNSAKTAFDSSSIDCSTDANQQSHPQCRTPCKYDELSFTETSILKYFNSEAELNTYLDNNNYASNTWDPTDFSSSDGIRPISFAIVFDDYSDWHSLTYTLRGNASYFPATSGAPVDKFVKNFDTLFWNSYGVKFFLVLFLWFIVYCLFLSTFC